MKKIQDFKTYAKNTWCPGCGNLSINSAIKQAFTELINKRKIKRENIVILSGIGCHGKIVDYIKVNSFYSLHGRVVPPATGIKLANPNLSVVGFAGDGDAYGEGLAHLIFAAKRNSDITMLIHNNRNYALTTGQFTPTSPKGFKGRSTPRGSLEEPLNPLEIMFSSGATFIARGFAGEPKHLKGIIKEAILHKGFSFVDILQPCVAFFNTFDFYHQRVYKLKNHNVLNRESAGKKIKEWNYLNGEKGKIPIGIFYKVRKSTFEESVLKKRKPYNLPVPNFKNILKKYI